MFVYSFKASTFKLLCVLCAVAVIAAAVIVFMPTPGSMMNVNKIDIQKELSKINVKKENGRMEYLSVLGFAVEGESESKAEEKLPKVFDAVLENYNKIQKLQGFDLEKYKGKKIKGYTYKVNSLPDGIKMGDMDYYATILVYKNKVVGADLCCPESGEYGVLVRTA